MNNEIDPREKKEKKDGQPLFSGGDPIQKREGGDDALADTSPTDSRADEKVIVNEQVSNKTVNAPSQTAVNTSEGIGSDEEVF